MHPALSCAAFASLPMLPRDTRFATPFKCEGPAFVRNQSPGIPRADTVIGKFLVRVQAPQLRKSRHCCTWRPLYWNPTGNRWH